MLSQKTVQHEAVLATLAALSHPPAPERLFPSLRPAMPQLRALGYLPDGAWAGSAPEPPGLRAAVAQARGLGRPVTLPLDAARYWLVSPSSWSLLVDARDLLAAADFPAGLANLTLAIGPQPLALLQRQPEPAPSGWPLALAKPLGAASQPFMLHSARTLTPATWPWLPWLLWALTSALLVAGVSAGRRSRAEARRQQEQARVAAMARLSTLGEMAAGIAHELNQPLTAILAQTRAAQRLLDDDEERPTVRRALLASAEQAKRAADIITRMRALVQPSAPGRREALDPDALVASLRFLREPELARQGIQLSWRNASPRPGRWPTGWRWNRSCTTWCRMPPTRWPAPPAPATSRSKAAPTAPPTSSASATTAPASPPTPCPGCSRRSTPPAPRAWDWAWRFAKRWPAPWTAASRRATCNPREPASPWRCRWPETPHEPVRPIAAGLPGR